MSARSKDDFKLLGRCWGQPRGVSLILQCPLSSVHPIFTSQCHRESSSEVIFPWSGTNLAVGALHWHFLSDSDGEPAFPDPFTCLISHNAQFTTEMCIVCSEWCIVGYGIGASWGFGSSNINFIPNRIQQYNTVCMAEHNQQQSDHRYYNVILLVATREAMGLLGWQPQLGSLVYYFSVP